MSEENVLFARETEPDAAAAEGAPEILTDKYLIFVSDNLFYGIDAEQVVELITEHSITRLPRVPHYVRGIINLRGQIIPIIDIRLRLGKPEAGENCIMVVNVDNNCVGILVDGVEKMVDIPRDTILPMPTQNPQKLISGMCSLAEGGTMLILDCSLLLHG
ncbi:MAG: chemotaxis protein CheW [Oscillospiraceae bacterium]|jgi:purine-binding chemotaxis protein CheW|nr:chemotaxis protein CheW [Oscillospiraceae bacterium]MCI9391178.1 chemotaxis protein CheW [Oscillospiraceae bacterium]